MIEVKRQNFRESSVFTATADLEVYSIDPVKGRPEESYLAVLVSPSSAGEIHIAFGKEDEAPEDGAFLTLTSGGSFEPLSGFFSRGVVNMWVKGSSDFIIIR